MDLLWHLIFFQHVGKESLELAVTIAWCMWYDQSKTRHGSSRQPIYEILLKASLVLEEFQLTHLPKLQHEQAQEMH